MPFDYTNLPASKARTLARTQLTGAAVETEIDYKLEDSAGTVNDVTYYRPFYVAAVMLMQSRDDQTVTEADGAKFFGNKQQFNLQPTIESLLREQLALDTRLGLTVPDGYDVGSLLNALCGCQDEGEAAGLTVMSILTS